MFGNHLVYQPNLINAKEKCSKAGFQTEQCSVDLMGNLLAQYKQQHYIYIYIYYYY